MTRCIFCKNPSYGSSSVEHIVPESMGNKRHVLPRGMVCDQCNNYFARKIEGPLLSHPSFRNLRAWHGLQNKKGVEPRFYGTLAGTDIDIGLRVRGDGAFDIRSELGRNQPLLDERLQCFEPSAEPNIFLFSMNFDPPKRQMSRLLAKMAFEALALRFSYDPELIDRLIEDHHYDLIRNWVRRDDCMVEWPYSQRKIFPEETFMAHPVTGEWVQFGFGYDIFLTRRPETYFAFCFYGFECVINVGGPSIKGFEKWLENHGHISPLIERMGRRLEYRLERGLRECYLRDFGSSAAGVAFDRAEISRARQ